MCQNFLNVKQMHNAFGRQRTLCGHTFNKTQQRLRLWPLSYLFSVNIRPPCHINKSQKLQVS